MSIYMPDGREVEQGGPEDRATWWTCAICGHTGPHVGVQPNGSRRCVGSCGDDVAHNPNVPRVRTLLLPLLLICLPACGVMAGLGTDYSADTGADDVEVVDAVTSDVGQETSSDLFRDSSSTQEAATVADAAVADAITPDAAEAGPTPCCYVEGTVVQCNPSAPFYCTPMESPPTTYVCTQPECGAAGGTICTAPGVSQTGSVSVCP